MPPILFRLDEAHFGSINRLGIGPFEPHILVQGIYLRIFGVTRDSTGTILGSCNVQLFETATDRYVADTTSDAATGEYEFRSASLSTAYFVVAYKAGSPDVAGTTVNTLVGS